MATSLKISEIEGHIDHRQFNAYHMVQRLWKSVQWILRYFCSERTSPVRHKIGCHGDVPWGIGKTGPGRENSRKYLPFGEKVLEIGPVDTEIALLIVKKKNLRKVKYMARGRHVCRVGCINSNRNLGYQHFYNNIIFMSLHSVPIKTTPNWWL